MEHRKATNPSDRRTRYTRQVIRQSLLELMEKKPFPKITVTEVCQRCEINRGTFYLHYMDLEDVLDDLIEEAFSDTGSVVEQVLCKNQNRCTYPLCETVQNRPAYRALFLDDFGAARILTRISEKCKEEFVTYLMRNSQLTFEEAEALFLFQVNGCLTINRAMLKNHCMDWRKIQCTMDRFLRAGLGEFLEKNG